MHQNNICDDSFFPMTEAEDLVSAFLECRLPKGEFTHEAHLITGLYVLAHHGPGALPFLRQHLIAYLASIGKQSDETSGYHETMTVYWLDQLKKRFADADGQVAWTQENLDDLLYDEALADRNSWTAFYSKERMISPDARKGYVEPDLAR